jgi:protein involved in polysaccharide export with SLBB domain
MKFSFYGFFAGLALLTCVTLTGCGTEKNESAFFMDTPQPRAGESAYAAPDPVERLLPQPIPSQTNVARFRVGQTVNVTFSGAPVGDILQSQPHQQIIKEDGTITLPYIGSVYVLGKTAGEVQNEIYTNYVPKYYVRLTVTVMPGDSYFYVGGEVGHPGVFQYISDTTVTKAIQAAGGLTPFSSHGKIWLIRASTGKSIQVNYDQALRNPAKDPPVYPDDQINVEASIF